MFKPVTCKRCGVILDEEDLRPYDENPVIIFDASEVYCKNCMDKILKRLEEKQAK